MSNSEFTERTINQLRELLATERNQVFGKYLLVGLFGVVVNESLLFAVAGILGLSYILGAGIGVFVSTTINYTVNDRWTWREYGEEGLRSWVWRGAKYGGTRLMGIAIHLITLIGLVEYLGLNYLIANLFAIGVGTLWGFGASDTLVWHRETTFDPYIKGIKSRIQISVHHVDRNTQYVLLGSLLIFVGFSLYVSLLYRGFWLTGGDFGSYLHAFESLRTGNGFLDTGRYRLGNPTSSYWGEHFSLILFIPYAFYALVPSPYTLIVVKSFALAASIPVVWLLARDNIRSDRIAGLLTASYALNPFLFTAWIFDFQEQIFLPVLLLGSYLMYERRRYVAFLGLTLLVLVTNEFLVLIMAGALIGYIASAYRSSRIRSEWPVFLVFGVLLVAVAVVAGIVIGRFNQFSGIPIGAISEQFHPFIDSQRVQSFELLQVLIANPSVGIESLIQDLWQKGIFFILLLVPVGFLPLQDELSLASIAPFLGFAWLFTGQEIYYSFGAHYPLYVLPFLYIGAIRVLTRVDIPRPSRRILTYFFVSIMIVNVIGIAGAVADKEAIPQSTEHMEVTRAGLEGIPANASVVTQNDLYPHIAKRPGAKFVVNPTTFRKYTQQNSVEPVEYIVIDSNLDVRTESWSSVVEQAYGSKLGQEYRVYQYEDGVWVFKYGYTGEPNGITSEDYSQPRLSYSAADMYILQNPSVDSHRDSGAIESEFGKRGDTVWFGPYESLPPGTYEVKFDVWISSDATKAPLYVDVTTLDGNEIYAEKEVSDTNGWMNVTLEVAIENYQSDVEFRGFRTGSQGTIRIREITVTPISSESSMPFRGKSQTTEYTYPVFARMGSFEGVGGNIENPGCGLYGPSQFDPQPDKGKDERGHDPRGKPCV